MGRIRTIKPELLATPEIASLTDTPYRVFMGLYSLVDDEGRAPADAAYVAGQVFWAAPRDLEEVREALATLELRRLISIYVVDVVRYLMIIGWRDPDAVTYQRIDKPQPAKFPGPNHSTNGSKNGSANGSTTDPIRKDKKGSEGKGREESSAAGAADVLPFPAPLDPVHLLATTAVETINGINGSAYKATSEAIRKDCQKLVKAKITPARLRDAILFVGKPWVGSKVEHRICPATLLQIKRVQSALDDIDAGNTPTPKTNGARSGRYEAGDADHSADKESGNGL